MPAAPHRPGRCGADAKLGWRGCAKRCRFFSLATAIGAAPTGEKPDSRPALAAAALASPGQDRNRMSRANREEEQEQEPEQSGAAQEAWMVHTHARRDHPIKISAMSVLMNILWNIFVKNACVFT